MTLLAAFNKFIRIIIRYAHLWYVYMDIGVKTIYALFIFLKWVQVSQAEVKNFFESACGEVRPKHNWFMLYMLELIYVRRVDWLCHSILQVTRLRLLGDHVHSTRIAFVEFAMVSLDYATFSACYTFIVYDSNNCITNN